MIIRKMMSCKIEKKVLFDFFKAEGIVEEKKDYIEIIEKNNKDKPNTLQKIKIKNLNSNNKYYKIDPENPTDIKPSKKTECVIIEYNEENHFMNIVFIEMKSKKKNIKFTEIERKFEKTFSWLYLLFNLLNNKEGKKFRVYFLLCIYSGDEKVCKSEIKVFHNLTVKYIRIIKSSEEKKEMEIDFGDLIAVNAKGKC